MGRPQGWASAQTGRAPMRSPGRPPPRREIQRRFWAGIARGLSSEDAALACEVSAPVGTRWFREGGGMSPIGLAPPSGRYLSFAEREEIAIMSAVGCGVREIARWLDRAPSTISRELRRNAATRSGRLEYRASIAQWKAERAARRPKLAKLAANDRLRAYVQERLAGLVMSARALPVPGPDVPWIGRRHGRRKDRRWARAWSPEQIANDSGSTSPMMSRCGSPTRPSTRRSMSRAAAPLPANWSRACAPGGRCVFHGHAPAGAARSSSAPRS